MPKGNPAGYLPQVKGKGKPPFGKKKAGKSAPAQKALRMGGRSMRGGGR